MSCPYCRRAPGADSAVDGEGSAIRRGAVRRGSAIRRGAGKTSWVVPGILLVFMPKCPLCLAAYIALATGVSLSAGTATWLRWVLIAACVGALGWIVVRWSLYLYRRAGRVEDANRANR